MKKLWGCVIFVFIISFSTIVYANAGPVFWQGYPSSDIISIEKNSPIKIENVDLVFDFSNSNDFSYVSMGDVTVAYSMVNPTSDLQSVQMAFPFVGALDNHTHNLSAEDIVITADNEPIPFDLYIGDVVKEAKFSFDTILGTLTDELYEAESFKADEKGKLYLIEVKPTTEQRINFAVDYSFNQENTKILVDGFNRYERRNDRTRVASWCYNPKVLEIFIIGEDIDFEINGYTDGSLEEKTDLFSYEISTKEIEVKSYLMENIKDHEILSDNQLFNLYAKSLDQNFKRNMGFSTMVDILYQENYQRILTLLYTVDFPKNSKKEVKVSYKTVGTMDRTKTPQPLYTFDYIVNPAENWANFRNFNATVIPPEDFPYIIQSNIDWSKDEKNIYTASMKNLPEDDLTFTLYTSEEITLIDKVIGGFWNRLGYLIYFIPFIVGLIFIILIGIAILLLIRRDRRCKN